MVFGSQEILQQEPMNDRTEEGTPCTKGRDGKFENRVCLAFENNPRHTSSQRILDNGFALALREQEDLDVGATLAGPTRYFHAVDEGN